MIVRASDYDLIAIRRLQGSPYVVRSRPGPCKDLVSFLFALRNENSICSIGSKDPKVFRGGVLPRFKEDELVVVVEARVLV